MFIGLKASQQRHVIHNDWLLVLPTSMLMAVCEVYVIAAIARSGWSPSLVTAVGLGSGLGAMGAMWLHNRWSPAHKKQLFVMIDGRKIPVQQE